VRAVFNTRCGGCHNGVGTAANRVKLDDIPASTGSGGAGGVSGGAGVSGGGGVTGAGTSGGGGLGGVGGAGGPTPLDDATLYNTLTTMLDNSFQSCGGEILVKPGDLAGSFLITKLTVDNPVCNSIQWSRMPLGCGPSNTAKCLTTDQLATIENWISGGAPH
jgi:hypothetical protein